jgi:thiamine pyrophosphate-dependent acetolactate synthase large subunit-like protein
MEEITTLREEVKSMIDAADEKTLRMMYAMLEVDSNDWWDEMPEEIKSEVEESIKQADNNEGLTHEEAMKKIKNAL